MTFDSTELQLTYDNTLGNMGEVCCGRECPVIQNALLRKPGPNAARRTKERPCVTRCHARPFLEWRIGDLNP